ncbi:hypothetical protein [Duganella sp. Root198D2]|uniref:hypothetical protein n=1 Tax=Duganella sp. Root198D2 TaxID=1736489 RepID=UPI00070E36D0|nr:hypothetical protein [Duganella sp. Root198D2]KRB97045.1 hypothetical protein ASE26_03130 [Duganella sp. Root198D2]
MSYDFELIQRQVALVSYGSRFLRKKLALEDWYRHGIFFGARLQFRDRAGNALLADDFTRWLDVLAQAGATGLSLHPVELVGIEVPQTLARCTQVVAVHYPDRYQLWAVGTERGAWEAGGCAGNVDCYLFVAERPGGLDVPNTDWKKLAKAIAADLDTPVPSDGVPAAPFCVEARESAPWSKMPLFVATGADSLAHRVLATLDRRQGQFANDMNPKNDNSHFQHLDETGAAAMQHWGERLDSWIGEVLLRAANIDHGSVESHKEERLHGAPTPLDQVPAAAPPAPLSLPPVAEMPPPAERKWTRHIGLAIAIAVLSVLVIAFAHIIARFPWLAVVLVLPWVLYMQQRK